jgi:Ca2+-binding EF-hand superfamily protein
MDESITTEMLKAADTDGDGEVSLDEFKAIMRAGPDVKPM